MHNNLSGEGEAVQPGEEISQHDQREGLPQVILRDERGGSSGFYFCAIFGHTHIHTIETLSCTQQCVTADYR